LYSFVFIEKKQLNNIDKIFPFENLPNFIKIQISDWIFSSVQDQVEKIENFIKFVQSALLVFGEIALLGFSMEDDDCLNSKDIQKVNFGEENFDIIFIESNESFKIKSPDQLSDLIKICMNCQLPQTASYQSYALRRCPEKVRASAVITMGKICMRDKDIARDCVNIFLRELNSDYSTIEHGSSDCNSSLNISSAVCLTKCSPVKSNSFSDAAVRSNSLLVLGDMCIRYTHLVDRHIDTLARCMQDHNVTVRKNALVLISQFILQDFVKWKGALN
jgi:condensin-2 complex subunit D3